MIRIRKPKAVPEVLQTKGRLARKRVCDACKAALSRLRRGEHTLEFDRTVYAHPDVKTPLATAQHKKCAFCESKVTHVDHGQVEHYRPKGAVQQKRGGPVETPGYYWLAYDWDNLLFSCTRCNSRRHKGNLFPLHDPSKRARSPRASLSHEIPQLIHPAKEDPEVFVQFRAEYAYAVEGQVRGDITINQVLLLNDREDLVERRRDHLKIVQLMRSIADLNTAQSTEARTWLHQSLEDSGEYAAMTRAALTDWAKARRPAG